MKWAGKGAGGKGGGATLKRSPVPKTVMVAYADMSRSVKADLPEGSVHTIRLPDGSLVPLEDSSYFKWTSIRQKLGKSMRQLKSMVRGQGAKEGKEVPSEERMIIKIKSVAIPTTTTTTHTSSTTTPSSTGSADATPISATSSQEAPASKTEPPLSSLREDPPSQDSTGGNGNNRQPPEPKVRPLLPPSSKTTKLNQPPKVKQQQHAGNIFAQSPVSKWSSVKALYDTGSKKSATTRALHQPVTSVNNNSSNNLLAGEDSLQLVAIKGDIEPTERSVGSGA